MELVIYAVAAVVTWLTCFFLGIIMDALSPREIKNTVLENAILASLVVVIVMVIFLVQRSLGA